MNIDNLIKMYENTIDRIVNPDEITEWDDIGFDEQQEGYESITEWLLENSEFNEADQITIDLIDEFIIRLKQLKCYYHI